MIRSSGQTADTAAMKFWEKSWKERQQESLLKQTQNTDPQRWRTFYDRVSDIWDDMTGMAGRVGRAVACFLKKKQLALPGDTVLELGCGPGTLALALAAKGLFVTAIDDSVGMINVLKNSIRLKKIDRIHPMVGNWEQLPVKPIYDLTVACFFPNAFSPEGLYRLESLSRGRCLLVLGYGLDAFPIRKNIWEKVMDAPFPAGRFNFTCGARYLRAAGRRPAVSRLFLKADLDLSLEQVTTYYREYFGIFGKSGPILDQSIAESLSGHTKQGRVRLSGKVRLAFLWWRPKSHPPLVLERP